MNEQVSVAVLAEPDKAVHEGVPLGGAGDTDKVGVPVGVGPPLSPLKLRPGWVVPALGSLDDRRPPPLRKGRFRAYPRAPLAARA